MRVQIPVVALCLVFASGALAEDATEIACKLEFSMSGWAVFVKSGSGEGRISCSNGEEIAVTLKSSGFGLAAGSIEVEHGHGEFSPVSDVDSLLGTYVGSTRSGGAGEAGGVAALVKGDVALALYGGGRGIGFSSIGGNGLKIERKE